MASPSGSGIRVEETNLTMAELRARFGDAASIRTVEDPSDLLRAEYPQKSGETNAEYERRFQLIKTIRDALVKGTGHIFTPNTAKQGVEISFRATEQTNRILKNLEDHTCMVDGCEETEVKMRCAQCKQAMYCGADHQKSDWAEHKLYCKKITHLAPAEEKKKPAL